jgi:hypothetical protein
MSQRFVDMQRGPGRYAVLEAVLEDHDSLIRELRGVPIRALRGSPVVATRAARSVSRPRPQPPSVVRLADGRLVAALSPEELRLVIRKVIEETLVEYLQPPTENNRAHSGGAPPKYDDPQEVVRQVATIMASAVDFWGITVNDVLKALDPPLKSRNSLISYLKRAGYMQAGESLKDTLRKLGRETLSRMASLAVAGAITAVTVGFNLTF